MRPPQLTPRHHPLFSPIALLATAGLTLGLAFVLWQTGGRAFSPGDLSVSAHSDAQSGGFPNHAAFGDDCRQCHEPWVGITAGRCETCHTVISQQRETGTGLHGQLITSDCTPCHSEHRGHHYDLFTAAFDQFTTTHHATLFPLDGQHTTLACATCHQNEQYAGTPAQCAGCHAEPDLHKGLLGTDCVRCHTTDGWRPAQLTSHTFPLDHGGEGYIACTTCHTATLTTFTCDTCHNPTEMVKEHREEGITSMALSNCIECHPTGQKEE